jgi:predicted nuclease with TOPRIM domain
MHDNNQYDYRIKKLNSDIEASQNRASSLEEELTLMCHNWEVHFEESVRQMRQRLDELVSGTTFEQIESLLAQIGEKDKVIG